MKTILLASAAAILATAGASAQDANGFYLGAGYTYVDGDGVEFDTINVIGGYDFTNYFAVEGEALFGLGDENVGGIDASLEYALGLYAKAQYPLNEQFSIFARAGYVTAELEASVGGLSASDSEDGLAYGAGAEFAFAGPNAVRFDYTRFDFDDGAESDNFGLSYIRRF